MSAKKRITSVRRTTTVDHTTGEVTSHQEDVEYNAPREPAYVKMYIHDLGDMLDIGKGSQSLMFELAQRIDYEGYVALNGALKKRMAEKLGIQTKTLRNYLSELVKAGMLRIEDTGMYEVNPKYFARGKWQDILERREAFTMRITYNPDGTRDIETTPDEPSVEEYEQQRLFAVK